MPKERDCRFAFASVRAGWQVSEKWRREERGREVRIWLRSSAGRERMWGVIFFLSFLFFLGGLDGGRMGSG